MIAESIRVVFAIVADQFSDATRTAATPFAQVVLAAAASFSVGVTIWSIRGARRLP